MLILIFFTYALYCFYKMKKNKVNEVDALRATLFLIIITLFTTPNDISKILHYFPMCICLLFTARLGEPYVLFCILTLLIGGIKLFLNF